MRVYALIRRSALGLMFAGLPAGGANAQSPDSTSQQQDIKKDKQDIRQDKKDLSKDRADRNADQKEATRHNLEALGFPMGGNVDTLLMQKDRPEWSTGAKGSCFAYIAKDYRVLLMFGDQIGDFSDKYNTNLAERDKLFEKLKAHFGHDWIMLANPA